MKYTRCPVCKGKGYIAGTWKECPVCKGKGLNKIQLNRG